VALRLPPLNRIDHLPRLLELAPHMRDRLLVARAHRQNRRDLARAEENIAVQLVALFE